MAGFWYEPEDPAFFTAAGGQASLGEIYQAARDASLYVDNTFAAEAALERSYDERNARIFELTGEKLDNPYRVSRETSRLSRQESMFRLPQSLPVLRERQVADWTGHVRDLAQRRPELAGQLMPASSIEDDALQISRDAEERFSQLAGSRDGAAKWLAAFAGGGIGSLRDPVQIGALMLGGGPGAARTVAGRILTTALSEAAVNAGVELALQPVVQSYRAKAGLESGVDLALQNAAFAGLLGGVFGAGARGLGELLTSGGRSGDRALAVAAADVPPQLAAEIRAGLSEATAAVRDSLPLPARGALDQVEMIEHLDATRPASALPEQHDRMVSRAHEAADALQTADRDVPAFTADPAQIARITDQLVGEAAAPAAPRQSLVEFIKARGGLLDDRGELAAIGAESLTRRGKGKTDKRAPLDMAREAAEEAGYIGRAGEVQTTTVADLLNAIDQELRGNPVFSRADDAAGWADLEAERARVEDRVAEAAAYAGPAVDDAIVREAAEISLRDGVDVLAALEQVLIRAESSAKARPAHSIWFRGRLYEADQHSTAMENIRRAFNFDPAIDRELDDLPIDAFGFSRGGKFATTKAGLHDMENGRTGEPMPGWSDAELEAASTSRGLEPMPENGSPFDNPGKPVAELEISPADVELFGDLPMPSPDGRVVSLEAYMADIANDGELAATVKACRA